jgi:hypothetical protein
LTRDVPHCVRREIEREVGDIARPAELVERLGDDPAKLTGTLELGSRAAAEAADARPPGASLAGRAGRPAAIGAR